MKALNLPCTCGMSGCTTRFTLEEDSEKSSNLILKIFDDKHEYGCFVSLGKEEFAQLLQRVKSKYKGL